jgi:hypothetical protein
MGEIQIRTWGRVVAAVAGAVLTFASFCGFARAQAPSSSNDALSTASPAQAADTAQGETQPLSLRYKFIEQYSNELDPNHPDWLTEYEVGSREKLTFVQERAQGAPERHETSLQTVYTERITKLSPKRTAIEVVRRYDKSRLTTTLPIPHFQNPGLLEQLTILYRIPAGKPIQIFNLTEGRRFRQLEFDEITKNPFLPRLAMYLPSTARRVGDVWQVPRAMTALLLSEPLADDPDYNVTGELVEVRQAPGGTTMTAVFSYKGQIVAGEGGAQGPIGFNARVHFTITPAAPAPPAEEGVGAARKRPDGIVEAHGYISEIRLAESRTRATGEGQGRLKQTSTRELVLARRNFAVNRSGLPLASPEAPPDEPKYTWVTYDHPNGFFHVAHPQNLRVAQNYPEGGVDLLAVRSNGQDLVQLNLVPKTNDPSRDRLAADPLEQKKDLMDKWKAQGLDVLMGPSGWLKEPEWAQLNRKVYRIEAALKPNDKDAPGGKAGRIYLDYYVVQFARNETLIVMATTTQDPHLQFRDQVEAIIKGFTLGPSEGPAPTPASSPASGAAAPQP